MWHYNFNRTKCSDYFDSVHKSFTFFLRPDAKFSDGSSITSEDVAFSFNRILYLDKDGSQILSRCLGGKRPLSVGSRHPSIQTPSPQVLVLGPLKCKETLLNELSNANYGVVPRNGLGADFKVKPNSVASGLFSYKISNGDFVLLPNVYNWRWKKFDKGTLPTVRFVKMDTGKFDPGVEVDAFRTSNHKVLGEASASGYSSKISLPVMTWYLTPLNYEAHKNEFDSLMSVINKKIDTRKLAYFSSGTLEKPARSFFPKEFNCDGESQEATKGEIVKNLPKVQILASGSALAFSEELRGLLAQIGIRQGSSNIQFQIKGQFLGDSIVNILNMVFRVFKLIPDPDGTLIHEIGLAEQAEKSDQAKFEKKICAKFYHYHHIPIGHRSLAFLAKPESLLSLFSVATGNFLVEQIPKLKGDF